MEKQDPKALQNEEIKFECSDSEIAQTETQKIFRMTLEDEFIPFFSFSDLAKELVEKKDLKEFRDLKDVGDGFVKTGISQLPCADFIDAKLKQKFKVKEVVFSKSHNEYVQIKNFDEGKLEYLCRFVK